MFCDFFDIWSFLQYFIVSSIFYHFSNILSFLQYFMISPTLYHWSCVEHNRRGTEARVWLTHWGMVSPAVGTQHSMSPQYSTWVRSRRRSKKQFSKMLIALRPRPRWWNTPKAQFTQTDRVPICLPQISDRRLWANHTGPITLRRTRGHGISRWPLSNVRLESRNCMSVRRLRVRWFSSQRLLLLATERYC